MPIKRNDAPIAEGPVINTSDPCYCPACGKLTFSAFPVHLRELDGTDTLVCKVIKCAECERIKHYGLDLGIGKMSGKFIKNDFQNWPELRRNNISPERFVDAILAHPKGHIWLDARNGLKPVEPEGTQAELLKRWEAFIKRQGRLWRAYD